MTGDKDSLRVMYLSGTVSIPPRLPAVADLTFASVGSKKEARVLVVASERVSPKLVITRSFFAEDVMSMFVPADPQSIDMEDGKWYEGNALAKKVYDNINKRALRGIVYVRENAQSKLEVEAGLTAAESAEYYPPLPDDRSVNHYDMDSAGSGIRAGCHH